MGAVALAGCAEQAQPEPMANARLGIAQFRVEEQPDRSSVIGLDAHGDEVARLDLVHGTFALTGVFKEDYETPEVDGRQLHVTVREQKLEWETAGYEPVLEMPAPPSGQWAISVFVADPHVAPMLARWQIGFKAGGGLEAGESPYQYVGRDRGVNPFFCSNSATCGSAYYGTINTCGGGAATLVGSSITQSPGTHCGVYTGSYDQILMTQCCPSGSGGQSTRWFAQKACPTTASNGTSCGTRTAGACKACPQYPTDATWDCAVGGGTQVGTCGTPIYENIWTFAADCQPYNCGPESACWTDDGCGGVCSEWGGYCDGNGCYEYSMCN